MWKGDSENDLRHHVLGKSKEEALMTEEELQNHRAMMHANRKTTRQYDKLWIVRENMRHRRNLILMGYKLPAINAEEQALLEERRPTWEWKEADVHEEWDKKWDVPPALLQKLQQNGFGVIYVQHLHAPLSLFKTLQLVLGEAVYISPLGACHSSR